MGRAANEKPRSPFRGDLNPIGVPFSLADELSRAIYNALVYRLPNVTPSFPYLVLHERDPRGVVSTFELEGGERFEVVVRRKEGR